MFSRTPVLRVPQIDDRSYCVQRTVSETISNRTRVHSYFCLELLTLWPPRIFFSPGIPVRACVRVFVHAYMYMYIYIYTHTHTLMFERLHSWNLTVTAAAPFKLDVLWRSHEFPPRVFPSHCQLCYNGRTLYMQQLQRHQWTSCEEQTAGFIRLPV
jgi:hypothetical protein